MRALAGMVLLIALVAVLLFMPLPRRWGIDWQGKLCDLGHIPLFAGLTLGLWTLRVSLVRAVLIAVGVAGAGEVLQGFFGRDGNLEDFLRGVLGVLVAVGVVSAWQGPQTFRRLAAHAALLVALIAWPVLTSVLWFVDAYQAYQSWPTIADFRISHQLTRWEQTQAAMGRKYVGTPSGWDWVGSVTFYPGQDEYPAVTVRPVVADWRPYRRLLCELFMEEAPFPLVLSLRSSTGDPKQTTHYQIGKVYDVGVHTLVLDLDAAARQARPEPLDLSDIRLVQIFTERLEHARSMQIRRIWLE